ncbi:MAG: hypothetical protein AAF604_01695 [Acidobacteriota bacterium]
MAWTFRSSTHGEIGDVLQDLDQTMRTLSSAQSTSAKLGTSDSHDGDARGVVLWYDGEIPSAVPTGSGWIQETWQAGESSDEIYGQVANYLDGLPLPVALNARISMSNYHTKVSTDPVAAITVWHPAAEAPSAGARIYELVTAGAMAPYPPFSGDSATAYKNLNQQLQAKYAVEVPVREAYLDPSKYAPTNLLVFVSGLKPPQEWPAGLKSAWHAVQNQIKKELSYLVDLFNYQTQAHINANSIAAEFQSRYDIAKNTLESKGSGDSWLISTLANLLIFAGPEFTVLRVTVGMMMAISQHLGQGGVSGELDELETDLSNFIDSIVEESSNLYLPIAKDWGKLEAFYGLVGEASGSVSSKEKEIAADQYELSLYQAVAPSIFAIINFTQVSWGPCGENGVGLGYTPNSDFWNSYNGSLCKRLPKIGVKLSDVLARRGGWFRLPVWTCTADSHGQSCWLET